jgi:hypothetical protein
LHAERGETAYVRQLIDACLSGGYPWSLTARNIMHGMRGMMATSLDEFVVDVPRIPVGIAWGDEPWEAMAPGRADSTMLDGDGAAILSAHMPVAGMVRLAEDARLTPPIRARIALAAWTRATILGRSADAARVTPTFAALWPALDSSLAVYGKARTPAARRFEAAWFILTHPGCRPDADPWFGRETPIGETDLLRDNLWCRADSLAPRPQFYASDVRALRWDGDWVKSLDALEQRVIPAADRAQAARERLAWRRAGPGINWLCEIVLAEVGRNPRDPRLPEALHRCVNMTRMSCGDERTTGWSRRTFTTLHAKYPASEWAKRTKYWYGNG